MLSLAGFQAADLDDPDRMVELARLNALYEAAAKETGDDAFGLHLCLTWDLSRLGTLGYAVLNAPTVGTGLRNLARYGRTNLQAGRIGFSVRGREAFLSYELDGDPELCRQHSEGAGVLALRVVRRLVVRPSPKRAISHADPRSALLLRQFLAFGAVAEVGIGLAMLIDPALVVRWLLGVDLGTVGGLGGS